jgi:hypothetical protein
LNDPTESFGSKPKSALPCFGFHRPLRLIDGVSEVANLSPLSFDNIRNVLALLL